MPAGEMADRTNHQTTRRSPSYHPRHEDNTRTKLLTLTVTVLLPMVFFQSNVLAFDEQNATAEAKQIAQAFGKSLKTELVAALQAGGPEHALGVCQSEAMPITTQTGKAHDATVSRVSLKNRNLDNVPNEWQRSVLEDFDKRAASGEDIAKMASVSVVQTDDGKQRLRFMKAIPTEGACLACHGAHVSAPVQAKLDELYPEDNATGYSLGQVRGAIVVEKQY